MIRLDVQDYCQECPRFEADTIHMDGVPNLIGKDHRSVNTVVRCKYDAACSEIHRMFERQYNRRYEFDGPTF